MTVYLTKVWGFGEPVGPLQFSLSGWRDRARAVLKPGDLVVLVGTKGAPTPEADRGRLLGIMEPSIEPVMSLDFDLEIDPNDFDADQKYKWPFALLNRRAWRILERPALDQISSRTFSMDSALGLVELTDEEAARVLALSRVEVELLKPSGRAQARMDGLAAPSRRSSPPPTTTRPGIMHLRRASAFTYAMEVIGSAQPSFKIGWAFDYAARARQFNRASLPELGGLRYKPILYQPWRTARMAYSMEQALLKTFDAKRHHANHEVVCGIERAAIESAWLSAIQGNRKS